MNTEHVKDGGELKTSDPEFFEKAIPYYKDKKPFNIVDDAGWGLKKQDVESAIALIAAARAKGGTPVKRIITVLGSMGVAGMGIVLILIAVFDPEPTSKLAILLVGGTVLVVGGGLTILWALGAPWRVKVSRDSFELHPEDKK
jgi:hypothetical protein